MQLLDFSNIFLISGCMGISVAHPLSTFHLFLRGIRTVSLITGRGTSTFAPRKQQTTRKIRKMKLTKTEISQKQAQLVDTLLKIEKPVVEAA